MAYLYGQNDYGSGLYAIEPTGLSSTFELLVEPASPYLYSSVVLKAQLDLSGIVLSGSAQFASFWIPSTIPTISWS
jgi:hypothetical protein